MSEYVVGQCYEVTDPMGREEFGGFGTVGRFVWYADKTPIFEDLDGRRFSCSDDGIVVLIDDPTIVEEVSPNPFYDRRRS